MLTVGRASEWSTWYLGGMSNSPETYDQTILANLSGALTPQAADGIVGLGFSEPQQKKMRSLAEKARSDLLSTEEREEADSFERISSLLGVLQSRARIALRDAEH
jgi:hypothetical protein